MVESATNNARGYRHNGRIQHDFPLPTAGRISFLANPQRHDNARNDAQRIGTNGNRAEVPHALWWRGNEGKNCFSHKQLLHLLTTTMMVTSAQKLKNRR